MEKASSPPIDLVALVKAILTRVKGRDGYVNKTKLFKYLYLIDLEHYRRTGGSLTKFAWIFHHYGPWAQECESFYSELRHQSEIRVRPGSRPDLETEFVHSSEPKELEDVIDEVGLELAIRRIVDKWADQPLREMLNYVYFHTEPMEDAERGKVLDFSKAERHVPQPPLRREAPAKALVQRMRKAIAEKKSASVPLRPSVFTPPPYDDSYFEALQVMEKDDEY